MGKFFDPPSEDELRSLKFAPPTQEEMAEFSQPGEMPSRGEVVIKPTNPMSDILPFHSAYTDDPQKLAGLINANRSSPVMAKLVDNGRRVVAYEPDPITGEPLPGKPIYGSDVSSGLGYKASSMIGRAAQEQALIAAMGAARGAMSGGPGAVVGAISAVADPIKGLATRTAGTALTEAGSGAIQGMLGAPYDIGQEAARTGMAAAGGAIGDVAGSGLTAAGGWVAENLGKPAWNTAAGMARRMGGKEVPLKNIDNILRPTYLDEKASKEAQRQLDFIRENLGSDVSIPAHQLEVIANPKRYMLVSTLREHPGGKKVIDEDIAQGNQQVLDALESIKSSMSLVTPEMAKMAGYDVPKWKIDLFTLIQKVSREKRQELVVDLFQKESKNIFSGSKVNQDVRDFISDVDSMIPDTQPGTKERAFLDSVKGMFTTDEAQKLQPKMDLLQSELSKAKSDLDATRASLSDMGVQPGRPAFIGGPASKRTAKLNAEDERLKIRLTDVRKSIESATPESRDILLEEQNNLIDRISSVRKELSDLAPVIESESNQNYTDVLSKHGEKAKALTQKEIDLSQKIERLESGISELSPKLEASYRITSPNKLSDILSNIEVAGFEEAGHNDAIAAQLREKLVKRFQAQGYMTEEMKDAYHQLIVQKQFLTGKDSALGLLSNANAANLDIIGDHIFKNLGEDQFNIAKQTFANEYPQVWDTLLNRRMENVFKESKSNYLKLAGVPGEDKSYAAEAAGLAQENIAKQLRAGFFEEYPKWLASARTDEQKLKLTATARLLAITGIGVDQNSATYMRQAMGHAYQLGTGEAYNVSKMSMLMDPKGETVKVFRQLGDKWVKDVLLNEQATERFTRNVMSGEPMENFNKYKNLALMEERKEGYTKKWATLMYGAMTELGREIGSKADTLAGRKIVTPQMLEEREVQRKEKEAALYPMMRKRG